MERTCGRRSGRRLLAFARPLLGRGRQLAAAWIGAAGIIGAARLLRGRLACRPWTRTPLLLLFEPPLLRRGRELAARLRAAGIIGAARFLRGRLLARIPRRLLRRNAERACQQQSGGRDQ